ncbi:MAG: molybdopterin-synthase adenylyltransferase [Thermoleophilaceae bacterium]|nr:molybdopterin-synthase adenylyltransferase [Thermoleophilaceae bacterium]
MAGPELPRRPRLRPYLDVVPLGDDRLLFLGGGQSVVLRGAAVQEVLPALLSRLNGRQTIDDIARGLPWIDDAVVVQAVALFSSHGLLEDAAVEPPSALNGDAERYGHQTSYWLSVAPDRYAPQSKLHDATVAIVGLGGVGTALAMSLAGSGIGRLILADPMCVAPSDALFGYAPASAGTTRATALCDRLGSGDGRVAATAVEPHEETLEPADVLVFCGDATSIGASDSASASSCRLLNDLSISTGTPWLRASVDHDEGFVGPCVIPGDTACFECFRLRLKSNFTADAIAHDSHASTNGGRPRDGTALLAPFATLVAQHAALEVIKIVTGFATPVTAGALLTLGLVSGDSSRHAVLKLPRCPACGPARDRPQMRVWDLKPG